MGLELWNKVIEAPTRFQVNILLLALVFLGSYLGYLVYYGYFVCPTRHIPGPFLTRFSYAPYYFLLFRGRGCMDTMTLHAKYGTLPWTFSLLWL